MIKPADTSARLSDFRSLIERRFLPATVKPGRFVASEWRPSQTLAQTARAPESAPLVTVCAPRPYESAVNDPLVTAIAEALSCDQGWALGFCYSYPREALAELRELSGGPFVAPQLTPLQDSALVVVPLREPSELLSLVNLLRAADIDPDHARRSKSQSQPQLLAVTIGAQRPALYDQVFDRVVSLVEFDSLARQAGAAADLVSRPIEQTVETAPLAPSQPVGPLIEVNAQRARFMFRADAGSTAPQSAAVVAEAIVRSGLTECEFERVGDCGSTEVVLQFLTNLNTALPAHITGITLRDLRADHLTGELASRLERYRRSRVEVALPSLAPSACRFDGVELNAADLCARVAEFQGRCGAHVSISAGLGFAEIPNEVNETVETLRALARVIDRKRGLKVRFHRVSPPLNSPAVWDALLSPSDTEQLFDRIRGAARLRGVSLSLTGLYSDTLNILIERGALRTADELAEFASADDTDSPGNSRGWDRLSDYNSLLTQRQDTNAEVNRALEVTLGPEKIDRLRSLRTARDTNSADWPVAPAIVSAVRDVSAPRAPERAPTADTAAQIARATGFGRGRGRKPAGARTVAAPTKSRVRFVWSKSALARFVSHLDCIRAIEGALLRAGLPVSYTLGQRPRMKLSFGPPLTLGFTSEGELFEAHFETLPGADLLDRLNSALPPGFSAVSSEVIYTKAASALEAVKAAEYEITLPDAERSSLDRALQGLIDAEQLLFTRTTKSGPKEIDLRRGIYRAESAAIPEGSRLTVTLALTDTYYVRPEEFLQAAGLAPGAVAGGAQIHRRQLLSEPPAYQRTQSALDAAKR